MIIIYSPRLSGGVFFAAIRIRDSLTDRVDIKDCLRLVSGISCKAISVIKDHHGKFSHFHIATLHYSEIWYLCAPKEKYF